MSHCCTVDNGIHAKCVFDDPEDSVDNCFPALDLISRGMGKTDCQYWKPKPEPVLPKVQRLAALVREALELVQKAHEEGTKESEGELDTWEKSAAFQAAAKIEATLEALEKEP